MNQRLTITNVDESKHNLSKQFSNLPNEPPRLASALLLLDRPPRSGTWVSYVHITLLSARSRSSSSIIIDDVFCPVRLAGRRVRICCWLPYCRRRVFAQRYLINVVPRPVLRRIDGCLLKEERRGWQWYGWWYMGMHFRSTYTSCG